MGQLTLHAVYILCYPLKVGNVIITTFQDRYFMVNASVIPWYQHLTRIDAMTALLLKEMCQRFCQGNVTNYRNRYTLKPARSAHGFIPDDFTRFTTATDTVLLVSKSSCPPLCILTFTTHFAELRLRVTGCLTPDTQTSFIAFLFSLIPI